jgi:hypothetical protein
METTGQLHNIYKPHKALLITAKVISYIFHPLFMPTYVFLLLTYAVPYEFAGITPWGLKLKTFSIFWMSAFFPAFAVFLLWRLKLGVNSMFLRTQKERIIPYIITMFFYWWLFYLSKNFTDQPTVLKFFFLGIFICTSVGLTFNNFIKISMHGMGVGGVMAAVILFSFYYQLPLGFYIALTTLVAGLVCTSRLIVGSHSAKEVYLGLVAGALCQWAAYLVIL